MIQLQTISIAETLTETKTGTLKYQSIQIKREPNKCMQFMQFQTYNCCQRCFWYKSSNYSILGYAFMQGEWTRIPMSANRPKSALEGRFVHCHSYVYLSEKFLVLFRQYLTVWQLLWVSCPLVGICPFIVLTNHQCIKTTMENTPLVLLELNSALQTIYSLAW